MAENENVSTGEKKPHGVVIFIDGKEFKVEMEFLNGAQIKALGGVPSDYQLFLEQKGEDKPISDAQSVKLENGMHFFAVPPATFGS
jgi:hypothetical protein